jgi:hypothetical protein
VNANIPQPWLQDALELLDLRRNDRVLVFSAPTMAHVAAVRRVVGTGGRTVVVEPDRNIAKQIAEQAEVDIEVLSHPPDGNENFGEFDAMLACPLFDPGLAPSSWGRLFSNNLRPGGRFVLDLPGEETNDHLAACWLESGGRPNALDGLRGPSKSDLAEALTSAGLRNVSASAGSHLVHLESPFALTTLVQETADLNEQMAEDLGRRLVERLKSTDEVDLVFHRTRVRGLH